MGRKQSMKLVETPYALVCDDDFIITNHTDIRLLMNVLQTTDISVVGGSKDHATNFEGVFRIMQNKDGAQLIHYPGVFYEEIMYGKCYVADSVKNIFLAKKDAVISAGSWDSKRPYFEHTDLFLRLKVGGVRVAFCPDVIFKGNDQKHDSSLYNMRMKEFDYYNKLLAKSWGITHHITCGIDGYLSSHSCEKPKVHF